jgi:uncharacterized protein YaaR (DUF327 family)
MINNNSNSNNNENINQQSDYKLIDEIDQKLIELLIQGLYKQKDSIRSQVSFKHYTKANKKNI